MKTTTEQNKRLVLEGFDTLFNKRDYSAAEKFWSPHYIEHSAHIAPGRDGLFNLIKSIPPTLKYEPGRSLPMASSLLSTDVFRGSGTRELDRGGHPSDRGWRPCRALGCHPGRGDSRTVQEAVGRCSATRFRCTGEQAAHRAGS